MNAVFFVGFKILLILLILSKRGFASASISRVDMECLWERAPQPENLHVLYFYTAKTYPAFLWPFAIG